MKPAEIQPIRTDADYQNALSLIEKLFGVDTNTPEGDVLDILLVLTEDWERRQQYELPDPTPIAAIQFRMEQMQLSQRDLVPYIGSISKVSEVLSGKRPLSLSMIRALSTGLNIPSQVLLKEPILEVPKEIDILCQKPECFPLKEMKRRGWFQNIAYDIKDQGEELLREWFKLLDNTPPPLAIFPRATRQTAKTDKYALFAWCVKVLLEARKVTVPTPYIKGNIDDVFLQEFKKLSLLTDGPILAVERLREKGVRLIVVEHLPKTHLDGALLNLNGEPVIGLTLRHDRIDNFWFTLMHEIAHLVNDFDSDTDVIFTDDMTLDASSGALDESEKAADQLAKTMLISDEEWEFEVAENALPSSRKVIELAFRWQVNPAIIAGRLRYECKNYRLFPDFVGNGEIKSLFISKEIL